MLLRLRTLNPLQLPTQRRRGAQRTQRKSLELGTRHVFGPALVFSALSLLFLCVSALFLDWTSRSPPPPTPHPAPSAQPPLASPTGTDPPGPLPPGRVRTSADPTASYRSSRRRK